MTNVTKGILEQNVIELTTGKRKSDNIDNRHR